MTAFEREQQRIIWWEGFTWGLALGTAIIIAVMAAMGGLA